MSRIREKVNGKNNTINTFHVANARGNAKGKLALRSGYCMLFFCLFVLLFLLFFELEVCGNEGNK